MSILGKLKSGRVAQSYKLAKEYLSDEAQKKIEDDYAAWCVFVKKWPKDKPTPARFATKYLKEVYFKDGVGSWRPKE